jgi:hypothetical protein
LIAWYTLPLSIKENVALVSTVSQPASKQMVQISCARESVSLTTARPETVHGLSRERERGAIL